MGRATLFLCLIVAFTISGIVSPASAITVPTTKESNSPTTLESLEAEADNEDLDMTTPKPSPSPSTEFSSRRGLTSKNLKELKELRLAEREKNSSAAASSKSQKKIAFQSTSASTPKGSSEEKPEENQQSLELELLGKDGETSGETANSPEGKYPRIYYGEALSPQLPIYGTSEEEGGDISGPPSQKKHPDLYPTSVVDHIHHVGKYQYPKNYVQTKSKGNKGNKKKRYEYKYAEEQLRHEEPQPLPEISPEPEYGSEHFYGRENQEGLEPNNGPQGQGQGQGFAPGYGYHGGHGAYNGGIELLNKALHLLLPSALLITGLSAVFPNRIKVPTNDFALYNKNQQQIHRYKRSIQDDSVPNEMLMAEHRSMNDDDENSYRSYHFEIGSPRRKQMEMPEIENFKEMPEERSMKEPSLMMGKNRKMTFRRIHQKPQEQDSSASPSSDVSSNIVAVDQNSETPKKKTRTRTAIKVRPGKRRTRPLPTESSVIDANEFEQQQQQHQMNVPHNENTLPQQTVDSSINYENIDNGEGQGLGHGIRFGDEMLKTIVQSHEAMVKTPPKDVDLSPDSPVMGLISSYAQHDKDSPVCQKRALCDLALKGRNPNATKFETFLWSLATLIPDQFSKIYELDDIFRAIQSGRCDAFPCSNPNTDLQI